MYHWPSWDRLLAYPEDNARKAAKDLRRVFEKLAEYRLKNKEAVKDIKFTLLTHSMGK